jgi:hypothetical protein
MTITEAAIELKNEQVVPVTDYCKENPSVIISGVRLEPLNSAHSVIS